MEGNLNWLVYIFYAKRDYKSCKKLIELQLINNPDRQYLHLIKGSIARDERDYQKSLECFKKLIELNPKNPEYFKEIGKTFSAMGRFKHSLDAFLRAETLLKEPDAEIYFYIGDLIYRDIGQPNAGLNEAKEYFLQSIKCGKLFEAYKRLAEIYKNENNFEKAIEMLEHSLQILPNDPEILTDIGVLYLKTNDTNSAFDKLLEVVQTNNRNSRAYMALGAILQSKNDIDGAMNKYKAVTFDEQDSTELWNNIGLCFFKKRKLITAIACLKKSNWLSPLNHSCCYNLGMIYLTAHQYVSALQAFVVATNIRPESAECYMMIGICLNNLQDDKNAYAALEKSVMLRDAIKNPLIYINFAIYCWQTKRFEKSQLYLDNFFKMNEQLSIRKDLLSIAEKLKTKLEAAKDLYEIEGKAETD